MNQYIFDTQEQAQSALDEINADPIFPITGINVATGLPAPDKQKTLSWCTEVIERDTDKKWYFERLSEKHLVKLSEKKKTSFMLKHKPKIEKFDKSWLKEQLEIA